MNREFGALALRVFIATVTFTLVSACMPDRAELPAAPVPIAAPMAIASAPVPLNPNDPAQDRIGDFVYAGGIAITSADTSRLHGLSDLKIDAGGTLYAVSDDSADTFQAKLVLDASGRLVGLTNGKMGNTIGEDGKPIQSKVEGDAEGLALMPGGVRLVSLERNHRILLFATAGATPTRAPMPNFQFPENDGMEGLAAYPAAGADAYLVGGEGGQMWVCHLAGTCDALPQLLTWPPTYGLSGLGTVPIAGMDAIVVLQRAYDPVNGNRVNVEIVQNPRDAAGKVIASFTLASPFNRDNIEGVFCVPLAGGGVRIYLLSDDNFNPGQRTLLMAFDWKPAAS